MKANVEYRLLSIQFRGIAPRAFFNGAQIKHQGNIALIENLRTPKAALTAYLQEIDGHEVKSIRYQIIATDPRTGKRLHPPIPFCHDVTKKAGVRLIDAGNGKLALKRDGGRRMFSNSFELGAVMGDTVDSTQKAYQFHE